MAIIVSTSMIFRQRTTQREHFDDPARTFAEIQDGYAQLARVNRLFRLDDTYTRILSQSVGEESCARLSILDLGAGDGWLGGEMERWAKARGWDWRVTNLDINPIALRLAAGRRSIAGSVTQLPFLSNAFDLVIASQMTHHLDTAAEVEQHFREAWRVARQAVFISDTYRSPALWCAVWVVSHLIRLAPDMRADGLLSVRRSWRVNEWRELAGRAGIRNAWVRSYFGSRLILCARKDGLAATRAASETTEPYRGSDEFYSAPTGK